MRAFGTAFLLALVVMTTQAQQSTTLAAKPVLSAPDQTSSTTAKVWHSRPRLCGLTLHARRLMMGHRTNLR
jgi:hypothetical protein